jgi:hypothetical protein
VIADTADGHRGRATDFGEHGYAGARISALALLMLFAAALAPTVIPQIVCRFTWPGRRFTGLPGGVRRAAGRGDRRLADQVRDRTARGQEGAPVRPVPRSRYSPRREPASPRE